MYSNTNELSEQGNSDFSIFDEMVQLCIANSIHIGCYFCATCFLCFAWKWHFASRICLCFLRAPVGFAG
jgi:hypothetical protein